MPESDGVQKVKTLALSLSELADATQGKLRRTDALYLRFSSQGYTSPDGDFVSALVNQQRASRMACHEIPTLPQSNFVLLQERPLHALKGRRLLQLCDTGQGT